MWQHAVWVAVQCGRPAVGLAPIQWPIHSGLYTLSACSGAACPRWGILIGEIPVGAHSGTGYILNGHRCLMLAHRFWYTQWIIHSGKPAPGLHADAATARTVVGRTAAKCPMHCGRHAMGQHPVMGQEIANSAAPLWVNLHRSGTGTAHLMWQTSTTVGGTIMWQTP